MNDGNSNSQGQEPAMSDIWRCDVTTNQVGTDTAMLGTPPCQCQGCRASNEISRLREVLIGQQLVLGNQMARNERLRSINADMLAALKLIQAIGYNADNHSGGQDAVAMIEAAITKATAPGEQTQGADIERERATEK